MVAAPHEAIAESRESYAGFATRTLSVLGSGPAFLLLHGYTDSADTWRPLLRHLAARGRKATAVDLPSHGHADGLRPGEPALPQLVEFAAAAADSAGPATVVVGNSLGGTIALLLGERSSTIGGVVPVCPGAFDHPLWLRLSLHPTALSVRKFVPTCSLRTAQSLVGLACGMSPGYLSTFWSHASSRESRNRLDDLGRRLRTETLSPYDHAKIGVKVMLVWGDRDRIALPFGARHLRAALPELRHEVLHGAGHCPQQQVPATIADLLCDFAPP